MAKKFVVDIPNIPAVENTEIGPEEREWLRVNHNTDYNTLIFQETGERPEKIKIVAPEDAAAAQTDAEKADAEKADAEKPKATSTRVEVAKAEPVKAESKPATGEGSQK